MLEYVPHLSMYRAVVTPPPTRLLCAWVDNPDPNAPPIHAEIYDIEGNEVTVRVFANGQYWTQPRARIHGVHDLCAVSGKVVKFYGEPKPCKQ